MDLKEIKQIVDMMKRADLTEFEIEEKDLKLRICRKNGDPMVSATSAPAMPMYSGMPITAAPGQAEAAPQEPAKPQGPAIKSPMVGTFYAAPSPESPPFVKVGDTVGPDTTVCIIEAMKVMNEIKAETSGTIAEILLSNGDTVEFGKPLFRLK